MNLNPYSPPRTPPNGPVRVVFSRLRIPLAAVCAAFAGLFLLMLFDWASQLATSDVSSPDGRLALVYVLLSGIGIPAFGLIAAGMILRRPKAAQVGLVLFGIGAIVQVVVAVAMS